MKFALPLNNPLAQVRGGSYIRPSLANVSKATGSYWRDSETMVTGIELSDDYRPSEDEPFMNERQREYFRRKLIAWKE